MFFSVVDVVAVLTEQPAQRGASNYWVKLKDRIIAERGQLLTSCQQLKMKATDGISAITPLNVRRKLEANAPCPSSHGRKSKRLLRSVEL